MTTLLEPIEALNTNLLRVLRYTNSVNEDMNATELAEVSGMSIKYIRYHSDTIKTYTATDVTDDDIRWVQSRTIKYYLSDVKDVKSALGHIVGYLMKYRYNLLGHIRRTDKIKSTGCDVLSLIATIKSRKETTGTPIHAQSKSVRSLMKHNKVAFIDKMFVRSNGYYAGHSSKKWKITDLTTNIIDDAISTLMQQLVNLDVDFNTLHTIDIGNRLRADKWVTYSSICYSLKCPNYKWYSKLTKVNINEVSELDLTSVLHLLINTVSVNKGYLLVSLNHTSGTNPSFGRHYNVFTRLRSSDRHKLGYINYDISAALQSISLQLINADSKDYPLLSKYSTDETYKKEVRNTIASSLLINVSDVKAKLTAFANGAVSGKDKHPLYEQFQEESDRLRRSVLSYTAEFDPLLLEQAKQQSKKKLPEDIDWFSLVAEDRQSMARAKSSVYFFVWTYAERKIRKAMLSVVPDGIEVHDAVYSKHTVDNKIVEDAVLRQTGFKVKITN